MLLLDHPNKRQVTVSLTADCFFKNCTMQALDRIVPVWLQQQGQCYHYVFFSITELIDKISNNPAFNINCFFLHRMDLDVNTDANRDRQSRAMNSLSFI